MDSLHVQESVPLICVCIKSILSQEIIFKFSLKVWKLGCVQTEMDREGSLTDVCVDSIGLFMFVTTCDLVGCELKYVCVWRV